ncbi:hypothetical protein [Flavobacterium sp.]|jgi:tRNA(fMet)-specific endonuclease VapC|uniref:hypothetical protein n=1 Tax=Flavobacterium sp. TaxID=239 RepID=UPI0037C0E09C
MRKKKYGSINLTLRKNNEFDLLIGATAIENKLILVTENTKDFERLKGIKMENWVVRK